MLNKLFKYLRKPKLYEESSKEFWNDEYISEKLLAAHLDSNFEGASRKHDFINCSVDWISQVTPIASHKKVLDLGCGPGLYTWRLAEKGYLATGIDFSKRSIEYARQKAQEKHLSIEYVYKNYLEIDYENEFDLVILIYCDFAVLSYNQRELLLKKIYGAMKNNGKFIFDVFTPKSYKGKSESNIWSLSDAGGFWQNETYLSMQSYYIYENKVTLDQYVIVDKEENINVYRMWNQCYTEDMIIHELKNAGFEKIQIYSDVTGKPYNKESKTMCIVAEK